MKHPVLVGILVFILLVAGVVGAVAWFKIASLKNELAQNLGNALGAKVEVSSLTFDLWKGELHAAGVALTNERPEAPWDRGEISQATVRFHLRDLIAQTMPLSLEVVSWRIDLHSVQAAAQAPAPETAPAAAVPAEKGSGHGMKVTELTAREGEVKLELSGGRQILFHGVAFESGSNGAEVWTTQLRATGITSGSLEIGASSVEIRGDADKLTFSDLHALCAGGAITGDGEFELGGSHAAKATLKAVDVPVSMLVGLQWQMKLAGLASGDVTYQGSDLGAQAEGKISIGHGKFNVLPFLGKMAALVGMPDITNMEVDKATTDFAWKDSVLHLANLDIRKNDVIRIAGTVDVDANNQIDGHLKMGLPDTVLAKWPQLQSAIFSVALENYGWTEVHLTGTPDHLQEDLSSRVLAVGLQGGGSLINQGSQKAMDLLKSLMGP